MMPTPSRPRTLFQPRFRTPVPSPVDQLLGPTPGLPDWDLVTDDQTGERITRDELIRRRTPVWAQDSQGFTAAMRANPTAGGWGPLTGWDAQPNKRGKKKGPDLRPGPFPIPTLPVVQGVFGRGIRSATMGATR